MAEEEAGSAGKSAFQESGKRHCTDCPLLLLFIAFLLGEVVICSYAYANGEPRRLLYGSDLNGLTCGVEGRGAYLWYPVTENAQAISKAIAPSIDTLIGYCVTKCPLKDQVVLTGRDDDMSNGIYTGKDMHRCDSYAVLTDGMQYMGSRCKNGFDTADDLHIYRCMADTSSQPATGTLTSATDQQAAFDLTSYVSADQMDAANSVKVYIEDLYEAKEIVLVGGVGGAMVLSFAWIFLLRCLAFPLVWGTIFIFFTVQLVLALISACFSGLFGKEFQNEHGCDADGYDTAIKITFWVTAVGAGVTFLTVCCLRKAIGLAIGIMNEASHAISSMPILLLWPIAPTLFYVAFSTLWCVASTYIYTIESIKTTNTTLNVTVPGSLADAQSQSFDLLETHASSAQQLLWYHLFAFFWVTQFFTALSTLVLAGAVCSWYWSADKTKLSLRSICKGPLISSMYRTVRYHMGSAAFGSLIIAIIKMIRFILAYIEKKMKVCTFMALCGVCTRHIHAMHTHASTSLIHTLTCVLLHLVHRKRAWTTGL
jgi:choline transporter-like protein 2/4/5